MPHQILRLEVVGGPANGRSAVMPCHSTFVVGRLPECGLSFPLDLTVSRQHFQIEFFEQVCLLTHLSQTGPTIVNGISVSEIELKTGDEITIGEGNRLRVAIERSRDGTEATTVNATRPEAPENAFTVAKASCGWNLYESRGLISDFVKLFEILGHSKQMSAVIDFGRIGITALPELTDPHYLFSWMPIPMRDQRSPVLTSVPVNSAVTDIIKAAWGKDGIVCFGSELKEAALASHWRKAIGVHGDQPSTAVTAYFWPSILDMMLSCQTPEQVAPLLGGLLWVFVEFPKSPGNWRLFTKDDFVPELTDSGLVAVPALANTK